MIHFFCVIFCYVIVCQFAGLALSILRGMFKR